MIIQNYYNLTRNAMYYAYIFALIFVRICEIAHCILSCQKVHLCADEQKWTALYNLTLC